MKVNPLIAKDILSLPRILIITLDYGNNKNQNNKYSLKYDEKIQIKSKNYELLSIFEEFKEMYYLANKNPVNNNWFLYENFKYLENIKEEIINNPLFKSLFLIYKLSNEESFNNNNNPIIYLKVNSDLIDIYFVCTESGTKYKINVSKNSQFIKVIHYLFKSYPESEKKNIGSYLCNAQKIKLFNTLLENNINNESLILKIKKFKLG